MTKIFGTGAKTSTIKGTTTTYCEITPPGVSRDACATHECMDVFDFSTALASDVAYQAAELKQYGNGHVSEVPVAGAGAGAVLVKDTSYGSSGYGLQPVLFFAGGVGTIAIQGSLAQRMGGVGPRNSRPPGLSHAGVSLRVRRPIGKWPVSRSTRAPERRARKRCSAIIILREVQQSRAWLSDTSPSLISASSTYPASPSMHPCVSHRRFRPLLLDACRALL